MVVDKPNIRKVERKVDQSTAEHIDNALNELRQIMIDHLSSHIIQEDYPINVVLTKSKKIKIGRKIWSEH